MPLFAGIVILIQFRFAFHVLKTDRPYWWIFIIMGFPVMGCLIYYFVEVFPGSREHRSARQAARKLAKALEPDADLKRRAKELEICGSAENKMSLAEECMNHQMYAEVVKLHESCLTGAFNTDGVILFGLASAPWRCAIGTRHRSPSSAFRWTRRRLSRWLRAYSRRGPGGTRRA